MSKQKKPNFNSCYVAGEVVDIRNARLFGEGETWAKLQYLMDVEVAEGQIITVEVDKSINGFDGTPNKQAQGLQTICSEVKTKVESGKGDIVNCNCKLISNEYYSKGQLKSQQKLVMDFCNREKDRKIEPGTIWKTHILIKEMVEKEDHVVVLGLTNEFMTTRSIKGGYIQFRIYDKEIIDGFKDAYKVGDVAPLEGLIKQINEFKTFDVSELIDIELLPETGFGSAKTRAIEENKKRIEINKNRAEMREAGGKMVTETYFEITGGSDVLVGEALDETPFTHELISEMETKIEDALEKSKTKDAEKNGDLPF